MTEIPLVLTLEEVNCILSALGTLPYKEVYTLVSKIQQQASQKLQADEMAQLPTEAGN